MIIRIHEGEHLERHSFGQRCLRCVIVPTANYLISEKRLRKVVSRSSSAGEAAVKKAGSTHAMESFYDAAKKDRPLGTRAKEYVTNFVLHPAMATRNRLRIVEESIEERLRDHHQQGTGARMLTLGGGTMRSMLNVLDRLVAELGPQNVKITNIDLDPTAHERGREIIKEKGYDKHFEWIRDNALAIRNHIDKESVDFVEMIGLMDYLDDEAAVGTLAAVREVLNGSGQAVVGNIRPTIEERFYRKVGWPPMYHRNERELGELLVAAGFSSASIELVIEPVGLHTIGKLRKE